MPDGDRYFDERVAARYDHPRVPRERGQVGFDEYDVARQGSRRTTSSSWMDESSANRFRSAYVRAAELDLMAELAGMRLRDRWGGWKREPLTSETDKHVSIWEKLEA